MGGSALPGHVTVGTLESPVHAQPIAIGSGTVPGDFLNWLVGADAAEHPIFKENFLIAIIQIQKFHSGSIQIVINAVHVGRGITPVAGPLGQGDVLGIGHFGGFHDKIKSQVDFILLFETTAARFKKAAAISERTRRNVDQIQSFKIIGPEIQVAITGIFQHLGTRLHITINFSPGNGVLTIVHHRDRSLAGALLAEAARSGDRPGNIKRNRQRIHMDRLGDLSVFTLEHQSVISSQSLAGGSRAAPTIKTIPGDGVGSSCKTIHQLFTLTIKAVTTRAAEGPGCIQFRG